jgi:hypothetical protein
LGAKLAALEGMTSALQTFSVLVVTKEFQHALNLHNILPATGHYNMQSPLTSDACPPLHNNANYVPINLPLYFCMLSIASKRILSISRGACN